MDDQTVSHLINPTILVVFSLIFFLIYKSEKSLLSARIFSLTYLTGAIGFLLDWVAHGAPGTLTENYLGNIPLGLMVVFLVWGIHTRYDRPMPWTSIGTIFLAMQFVTGVMFMQSVPYIDRVMILNFGAAVMLVPALPAIWKGKKSFIDTLLLWLFALVVFLTFARPMAILYLSYQNGGSVDAAVELNFNTFHIINSVIALALAVTLIFSLSSGLIGKLTKRSHTDHLTGLANRGRFETEFNRLMEHAVHTGLPLCLIICDLDHFKRINDNHGHAFGDQVIKSFADILTSKSRPEDICARFGGEEFVQAMPATNLAMAKMAMEVVRSELSSTELQTRSENALPSGAVTASFGIAEWQAGDTMESLYTRADQALYSAKKTGRNNVVCAPHLSHLEPESSRVS